MRTYDLDRWAQWMRACGCTRKTVSIRLGQVRTLCRSVGLDDPAKVTTSQLVEWLARCENGWTRQTYWASAHAWCRWLMEMGIRVDDPLARIPRPRAPQAVPRPVGWDVVNKVLADPPSVRAYAYVVLAAFAGLRAHEIAKVCGADVDEAGWLYVEGKGGQRAAVPLHPMVRRLAFGMDPVEYWFPGTDHGHVNAKAVSRTLSRALGRSGTGHMLRHTFGTAVMQSTHDLRVTQELMRHRAAKSTAIYTQVTDRDKVAAIRSLPWVG